MVWASVPIAYRPLACKASNVSLHTTHSTQNVKNVPCTALLSLTWKPLVRKRALPGVLGAIERCYPASFSCKRNKNDMHRNFETAMKVKPSTPPFNHCWGCNLATWKSLMKAYLCCLYSAWNNCKHFYRQLLSSATGLNFPDSGNYTVIEMYRRVLITYADNKHNT